jgi:hypothetical protein
LKYAADDIIVLGKCLEGCSGTTPQLGEILIMEAGGKIVPGGTD